MSKLNNTLYDRIYEMVFRIFQRSYLLFLALLFLGVNVSLIFNYNLRPNLRGMLFRVYVVTIIYLLVALIIHLYIRKSKINVDKKIFIYATILSLMLCEIVILAIEANILIWSVLILNISISSFVINRKNAILINLFSYLSHFFIIQNKVFEDFVLPQHIILIILMILSSIIAFSTRHIFINFIEGLMIETLDLEKANDEIQTLNLELEDRVEERTCELESALDDLKHAQEEIIKAKNLESYLTLVRGLSHQLNTPLGILQTASTFADSKVKELRTLCDNKKLTKEKLNSSLDEVEECFESIISNVQRAVKTVDALKKHTYRSDVSEIKLREFLIMLKKRILSANSDKDINIDIHIDDKYKLQLSEVTLTTIIDEIINNAIKFSKKETIHIQLSLFVDNLVRMVISDNGDGIEAFTEEKIFEPYFTTDIHSLGMGLFVVKSILEYSFNGSIHYDSSYKKGAKFIISLPKDTFSIN